MIPYILSKNDTLTVFLDGKIYSCKTTNKYFSRIKEKLFLEETQENIQDIKHMFSIVSMIEEFSGNICQLINGRVYFGGLEATGPIVDRILQLHDEGYPFEPMLKFYENLMMNPSESSRKELLSFIEHCKLPITPDGCFLAYKRVRSNYKDVHSNTISNKVGDKPSMKRQDVCANREQTCSTGLHFCSREYLSHFWGERVMVLKVNPADVVSIPVDYNNSKGRCCYYEVVAELDCHENSLENISSVVSVSAGVISPASATSTEPPVTVPQKKLPERDSYGRFVKRSK